MAWFGDVPKACISGCGCICSYHTSAELGNEEQVAKVKNANLTSSISAIEETIAKEQEQLGLYNYSEWEDMAYESLARNLGPRQNVKPKDSRVWSKGRDHE